MPLQFWNTLTRKKEIFEPLDKSSENDKPLVRMYTCGPTVYDYAHIGNLRTYAFEDLLRRYLKWKGYSVKQVMNITDIDDKTIRGCQQHGVSLSDYTSKYTEAFYDDLHLLNIEQAEHYPRATDHINEMVEIIQKLLSLGIAYKGDDGSIYYDISKFSEYGKLAHIDMTGLRPGARVSHDEYDKENLSDFALWKAWDEADGPIFWDTPLGRGRPGWHIECSAMSMKYLGESFDIHCGGVDNIFPHHQNEIAQSEAYSGKPFVKYWLHSEHLIVDNKKMSKSLGNFYTLRDLNNKYVDEHGNPTLDVPMALRYLYISSHYRSKLNFTFRELHAADTWINRLRLFYLRMKKYSENVSSTNLDFIITVRDEFKKAMDDDLNSPEAFGVLLPAIYKWRIALSNGTLQPEQAKAIKVLLEELDSCILGFKLTDTELNEDMEKLLLVNIIHEKKGYKDLLMQAEFRKQISQDQEQYINEQINERDRARKDKNWKRADEIRKQLESEGVILEDTPSGTQWKLAERAK